MPAMQPEGAEEVASNLVDVGPRDHCHIPAGGKLPETTGLMTCLVPT